MVKKLGGLILALVTGPALAAGQAPFCVYSGGGAQCFYYDVQSCQTAARTHNAMCAPNNQTQQTAPQQTQIQYPDIAGSMQRGYAAGQEARLRRAQIDNAELQNQALRNSQINHNAPQYLVFYKCPGSTEPTMIPAVGCVVDYVAEQ